MDAFDTHCAHTSTLRSWRSNDLRKLSYAAGDIIRVLATHDVGWWIGQCGDVVGLFRRRDTEPYEYPLRIARIHSYLHANSTYKYRTSTHSVSHICIIYIVIYMRILHTNVARALYGAVAARPRSVSLAI